jgi:hypothetical protein
LLKCDVLGFAAPGIPISKLSIRRSFTITSSDGGLTGQRSFNCSKLKTTGLCVDASICGFRPSSGARGQGGWPLPLGEYGRMWARRKCRSECPIKALLWCAQRDRVGPSATLTCWPTYSGGRSGHCSSLSEFCRCSEGRAGGFRQRCRCAYTYPRLRVSPAAVPAAGYRHAAPGNECLGDRYRAQFRPEERDGTRRTHQLKLV